MNPTTSSFPPVPPPFFPEAKSYYVITTVALAALALLFLCMGFCSIAQIGSLSTVSSGWAWLMFLGGGAVLTGIVLKTFCRAPPNSAPNRYYLTLETCIQSERDLTDRQKQYLRTNWNHSLLSFSLPRGVLYISQEGERIWCTTHYQEQTGSLRYGHFKHYTDGGHVKRDGTCQTRDAYVRTLSGTSSR